MGMGMGMAIVVQEIVMTIIARGILALKMKEN